MHCDPGTLKQVPLFSLLDDDEAAILAEHVEMKSFQAHQRIYKIGDPGKGYVVLNGGVRVTTIDAARCGRCSSSPARG